MTTLSTSVTWRRIDTKYPKGGMPQPGELVWFAWNSGARRTRDKGWTPAVWLGLSSGWSQLATVHMEGRIRDNCHVSRFHWGDEPPTRSR
jgi:hypothetical protein